jgi:hypothetical protein
MVQYFKSLGLALLLSVGFGSVAISDGKSCRYSLSNLEENHCASTSVKSYQDEYLQQITSQSHAISIQDRWDWCVINALLNIVDCTFLIRPDLDFLEKHINAEVIRILDVDYLSETHKKQLLESQVTFQTRVDDSCVIPNQEAANSEWDERFAFGDEVCRLAHYAERLMLLFNKYESP